jgi:hypothetical protein
MPPMTVRTTAILLALLLTGCGRAPSTGVRVPTKTKSVEAVAVVAKSAAQAPVAVETRQAIAVEEAAADPAADFQHYLALQTQAWKASESHVFHLSGSLTQGERVITAEIDGIASQSGCSLIIQECSLPEAKGETVRWDAANPLQAQVGSATYEAAQLAPLAQALPNPDQLKATQWQVLSETTANEDGREVVKFELQNDAAGALTVAFPVEGGLVASIERRGVLRAVVTTN